MTHFSLVGTVLCNYYFATVRRKSLENVPFAFMSRVAGPRLRTTFQDQLNETQFDCLQKRRKVSFMKKFA